MSHFSVLVIGQNYEEQLAPFDENLEVEPYLDRTAEEVKAEYEEVMNKAKKMTKKELKDKHWFKDYKDNPNMGIEEFWASWNGGQLDEEGNSLITYNPDSKWDWYAIGGRWSGMLRLKNGMKVDQATKGEVDFSIDKEEEKKYLRFWELYIEGKKPKTKEEEDMLKFAIYKKEYYLERYKTKEKYAQSQSEFGTFAVLKDGEWHEAGQMGWFGCSSATPEQEAEWDKSYYDKWIKDLPDDTQLTIVDCHI